MHAAMQQLFSACFVWKCVLRIQRWAFMFAQQLGYLPNTFLLFSEIEFLNVA